MFARVTPKSIFQFNKINKAHPFGQTIGFRHYATKVTRYEIVPQTLYRIQPRLPVTLRNYDTQMALGRTSFDLKVKDGLVHPAVGEEWIGPNGMSLRPAGNVMRRILDEFKGTPTIYTLIPGLKLPDDLIILHEHTDHYSLQLRVPMTLEAFNARLTEFLQSLPSQTREQFIAAMDDEDNQDN